MQKDVGDVEAGGVGVGPDAGFEPIGGEDQGVILFGVAGVELLAVGLGSGGD